MFLPLTKLHLNIMYFNGDRVHDSGLMLTQEIKQKPEKMDFYEKTQPVTTLMYKPKWFFQFDLTTKTFVQ